MFIAVSTQKQIAIVESLAREIWTEHYLPLIGKAQVEYMLGLFQSGDAIAEQIKSGYLYFLIQEGAEPIGYLSVEPRADHLFLSKIYVASSRRGRGYGRKAVQLAETLAKERGLGKIVLTVNKNNVGSIRAYEKIGFRSAGAVVQDIGSGFVMDDFIMEKIV
jgi:RimJ/RimL family protein N-acetyltransferase